MPCPDPISNNHEVGSWDTKHGHPCLKKSLRSPLFPTSHQELWVGVLLDRCYWHGRHYFGLPRKVGYRPFREVRRYFPLLCPLGIELVPQMPWSWPENLTCDFWVRTKFLLSLEVFPRWDRKSRSNDPGSNADFWFLRSRTTYSNLRVVFFFFGW